MVIVFLVIIIDTSCSPFKVISIRVPKTYRKGKKQKRLERGWRCGKLIWCKQTNFENKHIFHHRNKHCTIQGIQWLQGWILKRPKECLESAKLLQIHNPNTLLWQLHNSTPKIVHFKKLKKNARKKGGTAALLCPPHPPLNQIMVYNTCMWLLLIVKLKTFAYCSVLYLIKSRGYVTVDETIPASAPAVSRSIGRCSLGSSRIFSCWQVINKNNHKLSHLRLSWNYEASSTMA